jgi:hypothetical protein
VICQNEETPLAGVQFDLYRIADMDESGNLTLVAPFRNYPVSVSHVDQVPETLAGTLEGYILRDNLEPDYSQKTDQNGRALFVLDEQGVVPGLFLVMGRVHKQDGYQYHTLPVVLSLPYHMMENEWVDQIILKPKMDGKPDVPEQPFIKRKVLKIWKDRGYEYARPHEIVVELLRDGEVYDTQILSRINNWRYEWAELPADHEWVLTEKPVDGYRVSIEQLGITFVVTNTYDREIVVPTPTPGPTWPPEVIPTPTPKPTKKPRPTPTMDPSVLPQTGQIWWPVPALMVSGLILIALGLIRRRGD